MKRKLDYKEVGMRIRKRRVAMDITQQELAEQVDLSVSHVSNIETNKTKVSLESLYNVACVLQCTLDELLQTNDMSDQALANALFRDCDMYEREIVREVVKGLKASLKRNKVMIVHMEGHNT